MPKSTSDLFATASTRPGLIGWKTLLLAVASFCVGMLSHRMAHPTLALAATCVSMAALAAVVMIAWVAHRRRVRMAQAAVERAALKMQLRLERHCRVPRPHVRRPFGTLRSDRQYLTVVRNDANRI